MDAMKCGEGAHAMTDQREDDAPWPALHAVPAAAPPTPAPHTSHTCPHIRDMTAMTRGAPGTLVMMSRCSGDTAVVAPRPAPHPETLQQRVHDHGGLPPHLPPIRHMVGAAEGDEVGHCSRVTEGLDVVHHLVPHILRGRGGGEGQAGGRGAGAGRGSRMSPCRMSRVVGD